MIDKIEIIPILLKIGLNKIILQLESCNFECKGGKLENNEAFIELKKLAEQI